VARGLDELPQLTEILSPLESVGDRIALAQLVASRILDTIAVGCVVHIADDGELRAIVEITPGPPPDDETVASVVATGRMRSLDGPVTWAVLPLKERGAPFGALSVGFEDPRRPLSASEITHLKRVASALANALTEAAALTRAHQISQALQESLLPTALPVGLWFELTGRYVPGTADLRIGGDWYDAQIMSDGTVALSVGDVAGHGVEAAAQMGELRSAMAALRLVRSAPDDLISVVHRLTSTMGYFATAICARLDPTGNLVWASAGHLPPLIVAESGEVEILDTEQSPPLGTSPIYPVPINRYRLDPSDTVLLYTDGLIERRGEAIDVSLAHLAERISRRPVAEVSDLIDRILVDRSFSDSTGDDIAVLAARWRQISPGRLSRGRARLPQALDDLGAG
jgi:serine phosphatase RsbU (regulator of sigma subunit)